MVEKADNSFWAEHSINFVVTGYANWKSDGANSSALLADLNAEWKNNTQYDFVIGFTKDSKFTAGGIAYVYPSAPQSGISGASIKDNLYSLCNSTRMVSQLRIIT